MGWAAVFGSHLASLRWVQGSGAGRAVTARVTKGGHSQVPPAAGGPLSLLACNRQEGWLVLLRLVPFGFQVGSKGGARPWEA